MSDTTSSSATTIDDQQRQNRKGSGQDHDRKVEDDDETSSGSLSPQSGQQEDEDIVDDMMMDTEEEERRGAVKTTTETAASFSLEGQLEKKEKEISHLEEIVNEKSSTIKDLEEKLNRQKDYENIKRELSILKSEITQIKSSVTANGEQKLLIEKTKALQSENAALKAELTSSSSGHDRQRSSSNHHPLLAPFLPPLQNVEAFSSLLGEELANTYAKVFKAQAESVAAASSSMVNLSSSPLNNLHVVTSSPSRPASVDDSKSIGSDVSPSSMSSALPIMHHNNNHVKDDHLKSHSMPSLPKLEPLGSPTTAASLEKLQAQLRLNVEKFMNENLNTMNISRCVRELLSVHNIGQRLFAKYVLGLSQGTVSELLSKPKPWDKLTEKGRDSYRKMHAWAADEACIYQLKSLVPRKGKDATFKQDDPAAEERIQAILSEAQRAMITPRINGYNPPQPMRSSGPMMMNGDVAAALLKERQSMMSESSVGDKDDNSSENGDNDQRLSPNPSAAVAYANFRRLMMKKDGHDAENPGLPQEVVARIYQEELAKIIGQQVEESFRSGHPSSFDRSQDEVRQALAIYQQEISRLSHMANPSSNDAFARFSAAAAAAGLVNGGYMGLPPGLVDPATLAIIAARERASQAESNSNGNSGNKNHSSSDAMRAAQHSSAFSLVRPKVEDEDARGRGSSSKRFCSSPNANPNFPSSSASEGASGAEDLSAAASPLQRMASITNSLLSQTTAPTTPSNPSRPAKAVLPPITQQQFDQYNNLNTEDIVKHVKDQLSQYSISQRLFGESVLGLSQGSVSDLLARPKPWHMLTQKGREPFIRMKMFLEDDGAVHKLVASQYKIAPEKLMRTTGFVAGPTGPPINSHAANLNALKHASRAAAGLENLSMAGKTSLDSRQTVSPHSFDGGRSAGSTPDLVSQNLSTSLAAFAGLPSPALSGLFRAAHPVHLKSLNEVSQSGHNRNKSSVAGLTSSSRGSSYPQPSVYEMAALTTDLDTQIITTKIKETLLAHNIGQKIFGEVVLGLSQGSVSELLSKPKPWHMLSIKGREPFIRMQLWLSDPNNIDKLQSLKNERREANKRRRTNLDDGGRGTSSTRDSPLYNFNSNSSGFSPLSSGQSPFPSSGQNNSGYHGSNNNNNSGKKPRILFSDEQKEALRLAFSMDSYPTQSTIEFLASELALSSRTITNWFHNHRMRLKQVPHSGGSSDPDSSPAVGSFVGLNRDGATFDIVQFRMMLAQKMAEAQTRGGHRSGHSDKVSKFHGLFGASLPGLASQLYGNPNSCSSPGSSSQGDEEYQRGTLDLSMTSSQQMKKISPGSNRSLAGDSDRSRDSFDDDQDSVDHSPPQIRPSSPPLPAQSAPVVKTGSSRRKPSFVTSSSSRRKPAQPQWVDPGLHDFSGDDDEDMARNHDDLCDSEMDSRVSRPQREGLINGVCVRQSPSEKKVLPLHDDNSRSDDDDWDQDERHSVHAREEGIQT